MKVRLDYVTNSSSSSFILSFDNNDRWSSYEHFKEECDYSDYKDFYNLIHDLSSDYLTISNDTKETISIRPLIDRIKNIDFGSKANNKLAELYKEDYQLMPYENYYITINDLENNEVDLNEIDFEDIYEDDYSIDIVNHNDNRSKKEALDLLYHCYSCDYRFELLDKLVNRKDYETISDYYDTRDALEKSEEFKEKVNTYVIQNEEYLEKKKQIEEADFVVNGMIWDTNGGLLEWAIRNGFIANNFRRNHVITWNVG